MANENDPQVNDPAEPRTTRTTTAAPPEDHTQTIAELRAALRSANAEAKNHRLNADQFRQTADELRAQVEAAMAESKRAIEAARAEHTSVLETTRNELTGKVTEAETKATEALTRAQKRAIQADLKVAAKDAGMIDLDALKLLDESALKLNDDGDVLNAAELMAALKQNKPFLFGNATSSSTAKPPEQKPAAAKSATEMTAEEFQAALAAIKAGRIPTVAA